jgi:hypothetical protein
MQAELFQLLREEYQLRDTLRLLVNSRKAQVAARRRADADAAVAAEAHFEQEKATGGTRIRIDSE